MRIVPRLCSILILTLLACGSVHAQVFRAYLASDGSDANPCSLPSPCRLLPAAIAAVASGGEIWMLDSANYNNAPVNVNKSVTILAVPGVVGSVVATGGGVALNIATAGVKVALRNLVVVPLPGGSGSHGVYMSNGSELTVEGCTFSNLAGSYGVWVATAANARIVDSTFTGNDTGVVVSAGAKVDVSRSRFYGMGFYGVSVDATAAGLTTRVAVSDSVFSGNTGGVGAYSGVATAVASASVVRSTFSNNFYHIYSQGAGGQAKMSIASNLFTGASGANFGQTGTNSSIESLGNNLSFDNTPGLGSITALGGI